MQERAPLAKPAMSGIREIEADSVKISTEPQSYKSNTSPDSA
jgi:hypothetical protein